MESVHFGNPKIGKSSRSISGGTMVAVKINLDRPHTTERVGVYLSSNTETKCRVGLYDGREDTPITFVGEMEELHVGPWMWYEVELKRKMRGESYWIVFMVSSDSHYRYDSSQESSLTVERVSPYDKGFPEFFGTPQYRFNVRPSFFVLCHPSTSQSVSTGPAGV